MINKRFFALSDNRTELFNLNCRLMNFIQNLKERCNVESQGKHPFSSVAEKYSNNTNSLHQIQLQNIKQ